MEAAVTNEPFSDSQIHVEDIVCEGQKVVVRYRLECTKVRPVFGVSPRDRRLTTKRHEDLPCSRRQDRGDRRVIQVQGAGFCARGGQAPISPSQTPFAVTLPGRQGSQGHPVGLNA